MDRKEQDVRTFLAMHNFEQDAIDYILRGPGVRYHLFQTMTIHRLLTLAEIYGKGKKLIAVLRDGPGRDDNI